MSESPNTAAIAAGIDNRLDRLMAGIDPALFNAPTEGYTQDQSQLYELARQALLDGRLDAALDGFAALAMLAPGKPEYQFGFALCLQHFGQVEEAGRHFSAALVLDPSDAACAYRLGECLAACGYVEDARDALNVALALCSLPETDAAIRPLTESLLDRLV